MIGGGALGTAMRAGAYFGAMPRWIVAVLLLGTGCGGLAQDEPAPERVAPRPVMVQATATEVAPAVPKATRGEVVLVVLGRFPDHLLDAVEHTLERELQVEVRRAGTRALPKAAFYRPRRRWRADTILELLPGMVPDADPDAKILGLTGSDISTTKGKFEDWGIFGLGQMPGRAAVVSSFRLRRKTKDRALVKFRVANTALHEIGHTFGLDHCDEPNCPMLDAEGGIANTDSSTGHLGPGCQAKLDAAAPL